MHFYLHASFSRCFSQHEESLSNSNATSLAFGKCLQCHGHSIIHDTDVDKKHKRVATVTARKDNSKTARQLMQNITLAGQGDRVISENKKHRERKSLHQRKFVLRHKR